MRARAIKTRLEKMILRYRLDRDRWYMDARSHATLVGTCEEIDQVTIYIDHRIDFEDLAGSRRDLIDDHWNIMFLLEKNIWVAYSKDSRQQIVMDRSVGFRHQRYDRVTSARF